MGTNLTLTGSAQFAYLPSMPVNAIDYMDTAAISASLPLYAGGQIRNGNKLARLATDENRLKLDMTTSEVLLRIEQLYWAAVSLVEKMKTLENYTTLLYTLNRDVTSYLEAGLVQRNDLLKVQLNKMKCRRTGLNLKMHIR
ncbi:MAG TPA: TolC family protein [Bacteroidales bacterium]|nr:TolC family protein [Bacteroidales bacterium]